MLPEHCKDVAVKEVPFELTEENISESVKGKRAYTRCEYYVLRHGNDTAVVGITKADGVELFRPIISHEIVSMPADTLYLKDEDVNVINQPAMAEVSQHYPDKTVVVEGKFGHVSFTSPGRILKLDVLDVVPPYPSKLSSLVKTALDSGMIDLPIAAEYSEIDINKLAQTVQDGSILFPCKASGLQSDKKDYYLDQLPEIKEKCTLIGCELSERIYRSIYNDKIERVEMCPRKLAPNDGRKRIVKCCKIKNGHKIDGNLAIVPWGATVKVVIDAVNDLFSADSSHSSSP